MILEKEQMIRFINDQFSYEVTQLIYGGQFYCSVLKHKDRFQNNTQFTIFKNIAIEHILLHSRNLLEFFYYRGEEAKYARAYEYVKGWSAGDKSAIIKELERRVNEEISHLSWKRLGVKPEEKSWDLIDLINSFVNTTKDFLNRVDSELCKEGVSLLKSELERVCIQKVKTKDGDGFTFTIDILSGL